MSRKYTGMWLRGALAGLALCLSPCLGHAAGEGAAKKITLRVEAKAAPRVKFGAEKLGSALRDAGYEVTLGELQDAGTAPASGEITIATEAAPKAADPTVSQEGFKLTGSAGGYAITGKGPSGTLYGCEELAGRITAARALPDTLDFTDAPQFKLRGPCIAMQLPSKLPNRGIYEYPYTPQNFPWFYDKARWIEYLDFLAKNRMNTLYLWNGHPFASLVKLKDYPYAIEVPEDVFQKNVEMFHFLTEEADKRGIWVIQMFYNIFVSQPFAEKNGIHTQLAEPTALVADYTRKSIAEFVANYPNVGLYCCLGEALKGQENQEQWLNETIIPGMQDAMKRLGTTQEPPIVVRNHTVGDMQHLLASARKLYGNICTEAKYNGESITTTETRGRWLDIHKEMSRDAAIHITNIHLLSNLEPFRWGDQRFIQQTVKSIRDDMGARGVHLYPLAYWDWPNSPDKTDPLLVQYKRDWIWFEAWARYTWNDDRKPDEDHKYWVGRLAEMYGSPEAAEHILAAYNTSGECAPRLLRRFGITDGNRQTLSLGMTLDQLVHPQAYGVVAGLWDWYSPPGERLQDYLALELMGAPHEGETPPQAIKDCLELSARAMAEAALAEPLVTKNKDEFERLKHDMECIHVMCEVYGAKAEAALCQLRYEQLGKVEDMREAEKHLADSLAAFRKLTMLTENTYRYANSLQIGHRRIPVRGEAEGGKPAFYHWTQMLPIYEKELADFKLQVAEAERAGVSSAKAAGQGLPGVAFKVLTDGVQTYKVMDGAMPFSDMPYKFKALAPELQGLTGIRVQHKAALRGELKPIKFSADRPVKVLVGYFKDGAATWAKPPNPDFDSAAAEHGGIEASLQNAATLDASPAMDVHVFNYAAGAQEFDPRGKGSYVILGVIDAKSDVSRRDAKLPGGPVPAGAAR